MQLPLLCKRLPVQILPGTGKPVADSLTARVCAGDYSLNNILPGTVAVPGPRRVSAGGPSVTVPAKRCSGIPGRLQPGTPDNDHSTDVDPLRWQRFETQIRQVALLPVFPCLLPLLVTGNTFKNVWRIFTEDPKRIFSTQVLKFSAQPVTVRF